MECSDYVPLLLIDLTHLLSTCFQSVHSMLMNRVECCMGMKQQEIIAIVYIIFILSASWHVPLSPLTNTHTNTHTHVHRKNIVILKY